MLRRQRKTLRIRHLTSQALGAATALLLTASTVWSQNVTIQQPAVEVFSVNTTVSVPDRGGIYLGGVGRAGSSRQSFGFARPGTSTGTFTEGSSVSAHVWIQDLREMDRMVLESTEHSRYQREDNHRLSPNAAQAANVLRERHAQNRGRSAASKGTAAANTTVGLHINRRR